MLSSPRLENEKLNEALEQVEKLLDLIDVLCPDLSLEAAVGTKDGAGYGAKATATYTDAVFLLLSHGRCLG